MHVIGLDIGGANIKAADNDGAAFSLRFALWKEPERLPHVLQSVLREFDAPDEIAVTMTAELCDCFETKAQGVDVILRAVEQAADGVEIRVWQTGAEFVSVQTAREIPLLVAAANWHTLATFCGRIAPRDAALLIDVGTTTTDVIPLLDGTPVPAGMTDLERLQSGELVYTGVRRTPLCALAGEVTLGARGGIQWPLSEFECGGMPECEGQKRTANASGTRTPSHPHTLTPSYSHKDTSHAADNERISPPVSLAAELFATTLDVYILLGELAEDPADRETANGKPATKPAARDRIARMLCCDRTELTAEQIQQIAEQFARRQSEQISAGVDRVLGILPSDCRSVIVSGCGHFLARHVVENHPELRSVEVVPLSDFLSPEIAESACAFAVARLAAEGVDS